MVARRKIEVLLKGISFRLEDTYKELYEYRECLKFISFGVDSKIGIRLREETNIWRGARYRSGGL